MPHYTRFFVSSASYEIKQRLHSTSAGILQHKTYKTLRVKLRFFLYECITACTLLSQRSMCMSDRRRAPTTCALCARVALQMCSY